eukprot:1186753-Prorocentrum_minimum.AAC.2
MTAQRGRTWVWGLLSWAAAAWLTAFSMQVGRGLLWPPLLSPAPPSPLVGLSPPPHMSAAPVSSRLALIAAAIPPGVPGRPEATAGTSAPL